MDDKTAKEAIGGCLALLVLSPALLAVEAWWLMLLIGAVHHDVIEEVPAYGFWQTVLVVLVLNAVAAIFKKTTSGGSK